MTLLKGFTNFGDSTITNHIQENVRDFLDYGLLEKGNFIDVEIPSVGIYGGDDHVLRPVDDPRYTYGQVWQGVRSNWVWETGVGAISNTDPSNPGVSGVYVDGTWYPNATAGAYAHHINHPFGRVVFDSPISTSSEVTCSYSYKYVNVCRSNGLNWFKEIQKRSERSDDSNFINNSGEWSTLADNRHQLPAIGIELAPRRVMNPYQLGGGQIVFTDLLFHCVAEDVYTRDSLIDAVMLQNQKVFNAYSLDTIDSNGAFPVDYRGVPNSGALDFPSLTCLYPGNHIRLVNAGLNAAYSMTPDIHVATAKITTECILFGV